MKTPQLGPRRRTALAGLFLLALLGVGSTGPQDTAIPELSQEINAFTLDWLQHCARTVQADGNLVLSPQSVFHGLAMTYVASGGATREELARVLRFPTDNEALASELGSLRRQLQLGAGKGRRLDVNLANSVWLDSTYASFQKDYLRNLDKAFEAPLHPVKFRDAAKTADTINRWVSRMTRGKIPEAVSADDFKSASRPGVIEEPALVTVNAVYFKADWGSKFDKNSTRPRPFQVRPGASQDTPMMQQNSLLPYAENARLKFLEVPYIEGRYSMYVLLPKEVLAIPQLMELVSTDAVAQLRREAKPHQVDVWLPKFEMTTRQSVKSVLGDMGVRCAFDRDKADFDRMLVKKPEAFRMYLSEVYHDAWIDVHEEGTRAAAASTSHHFSIGCAAPPRPIPAEFHADHPFLFLIVHNQSRSVLFGGWLAKPPK